VAVPLSPDHLALARAMRGFRAELGISQEELAHRSGLARTYVSSVERGERNLGYANLRRIAAALEVPASAWVARAEDLAARMA
jgi:transcriptional regulator with XRE-family HTH domain